MKKVTKQVSSFSQFGFDINAIFIKMRNDHSFNNVFILKLISKNKFFNYYLKRIIFFREINRAFNGTIRSLCHNDILYYRYSGAFPLYYPYRYLRRYRDCKLVTEHQTKEINEYKLKRAIFSFLCEFIFGKLIINQSDAIIGVTDEITQYELLKAGTPNKPHITIGNGFDVNSVEIRKSSLNFDGELHFLCVANVSRWHGLDRFIKSLVDNNSSIHPILHIAGDGPDIPNLKKIVSDFNLFEKVIFHDFTTGAALDNLFNTCHIAVGSLGLHRIGLTESSTLKVREYCARGIPWIIGCKDPDFPDDFPYIHRIYADESPVNIEEVIEFAKRVYADPDHPQKLREYAFEHLDWSVKMKKLKTFLESLVEESPSEA